MCRHCGAGLDLTLVDLGSAPPSNAYLTRAQLSAVEKWFPLRVLVCENCWLVQTQDFAQPEELFDAEYAYFSGFSDSWVEHCRDYVEVMARRFSLGSDSHFVEVASNDGTLLDFAVKRGIRATGIEPTHATAEVSRGRGHTVVEEFLGGDTGAAIRRDQGPADLIAANNVLAHVPDINSFVAGIAELLAPSGVVTFEFPHLVNLIEYNQFDTIYHEHYSYLSLTAVRTVLGAAGLQVWDVQTLPTHGGSLRVFAQHNDGGPHEVSSAVAEVLEDEVGRGVDTSEYYAAFQRATEVVKDDALAFLLEMRRAGKVVAAYGAAAKGNTLLNFAGVRPDLINFVVDLNPAKQGKFMPGSRIPIVGPEALDSVRTDFLVILPWNLRTEVAEQLAGLRDGGTAFVTFVPDLQVD